MLYVPIVQYGPKYQKRSNEFVYKDKKGSKRGSRYKKVPTALEMDVE